jgi:hypothetical protein
MTIGAVMLVVPIYFRGPHCVMFAGKTGYIFIKLVRLLYLYEAISTACLEAFATFYLSFEVESNNRVVTSCLLLPLVFPRVINIILACVAQVRTVYLPYVRR